MFKKGTKAYSIFKNRCPKCQNGHFFEDDNSLHLKKVFKMHERCPKCNFKYQIEPSFFYGAMYVSYALSVAIAVATFIFLYAFNLNFIEIFIGIIIALILTTPYVYRWSRLIYINFFISYDKDYNMQSKTTDK